MFAVSRPRHRWRQGAWREELRRDLESVRALVDAGPVDVYLVGGLGLAVRGGDFYRNHGDIDLAVFDHDLPAFWDHTTRAGYRWARAVAAVAVSPWHRVDVARPLPCPQPGGALRLTRPGRARVTRADFLDVMLLADGPDGVELGGTGVTVPWPDFLPAVPVPGSRRLRLPAARHKAHLPARWPRQRRDLRAAALT